MEYYKAYEGEVKAYYIAKYLRTNSPIITQTELIISEDTLNIDYLNLKVQKENFFLHFKEREF